MSAIARPSDIAVLLFANSARAESRRKALGLPPRRAARVHDALLRRVRGEIAAAGLESVHVDERRQRGETFGERIACAVAFAFARGHRRLLVVGGDCPSLRREHLAAAARDLRAGARVLVPDARGGAAVLSVCADSFDADRFAGLPWQTRRLAGALRAGGYGTGGFAQAPLAEYAPLADLNERSDLRGPGLSAAAPSWLDVLLCTRAPRLLGSQMATGCAGRGFGESPRALRGPPTGAVAA